VAPPDAVDADRLTGAPARRRQAAVAGHSGDPETARHLIDDPDAGVRVVALGALDRLDDLSDLELERGLADPAPSVRRRACEIVASRPGAPTAATDGGDDRTGHVVSLLGLLADPDPVVVEVAAWACGERVPPEPGAVARLAELTASHDDALCREAAVAALGAIGDEVALPAILAATHDKATVRRRAVIALAPFDGPEVDAALEAARTDRDWQVRQAAEDQLAAD
jgi:HEAT repeat protein